jgi:outer membrane lipoprotein-sorting protein
MTCLPRLRLLLCSSVLASGAFCLPASAQPPEAEAIVQKAMDNWRSSASWSRMQLIVHRPNFERTLAFEAWTRGTKDSLSRFTKPAKEAGNASLKLAEDMWMFSPKLQQVMKLPSSLMSQSWMGSDFSYDDLAKSDRLLVDYELTLTDTKETSGHTVYSIEAIPKDNAPVVWGKQTLEVRDDSVLLEQLFFDQDMKPLRRMTAEKIEKLGGRIYATVARMSNLEKDDHWTEIVYDDARFDVELPDYLFSLSNLQNPRPWKPK